MSVNLKPMSGRQSPNGTPSSVVRAFDRQVSEIDIKLEARARLSGGTSNEFIYKRVAQELEERDTSGVLVDVGCGTGGFRSFIRNHFASYIGVDAVRYEGFPADARFAPIDL